MIPRLLVQSKERGCGGGVVMAVVACPFCKSPVKVSGGSERISACRCGAKYLVEAAFSELGEEITPELGSAGRERNVSVIDHDGTPYDVTFF